MRISDRLCAVAAMAAAALVAGACASVDTGGAAGPPAPAPDYRVGDRWVYHVVDGFRAKIVWDETHEITAIGADGITVRSPRRDPTFNVDRVEKWSAPGVVLQGSVYEDETRPLRSGPRSLPVSAGDGRAVGPAPRRPRQAAGAVRRHHALCRRRRLREDHDARRHVRRDRHARHHAAGRRNLLALSDRVQLPRLVCARGRRLGARGQEGAVSRQGRRQDASGYHPGQNATVELTSFTRGR